MIREYAESDIIRIINIWYEGSIEAHDFIARGYWEKQKNEMKEKYRRTN